MLISTGCPAKKGVSLHWDKGSSNSAFSFKVSPVKHPTLDQIMNAVSLADKSTVSQPEQGVDPVQDGSLLGN